MSTLTTNPTSPANPTGPGMPNGGGTPSLLRRILSQTRSLFTSPKYGPVLVTLVLLIIIFAIGGSRYRGFVSGDRKSTRLNSSHGAKSRMPSSA